MAILLGIIFVFGFYIFFYKRVLPDVERAEREAEKKRKEYERKLEKDSRRKPRRE